MEILGIVLGAITAIPLISIAVTKIYQFIKRNVLYGDISCGVLKHTIRGKSFNTKIKIAYAGKGNEVIRDILITYELKLFAPIDRFLAYVRIATAYLKCDMQGLATVLGTRDYKTAPMMVHIWKSPKLVKYPLSVINGIFFSYLTALMTITPIIGWMFLNWGPYGKFSLDSVNSSLRISDADGNVIQLPIVLNEGREITLDIHYRMGLNAKGFEINTPYKFLDSLPPRTFLPPKPGMFGWVGRGSINVFIGKRWNRLLTELDKRVIVGIGSN